MLCHCWQDHYKDMSPSWNAQVPHEIVVLFWHHECAWYEVKLFSLLSQLPFAAEEAGPWYLVHLFVGEDVLRSVLSRHVQHAAHLSTCIGPQRFSIPNVFWIEWTSSLSEKQRHKSLLQNGISLHEWELIAFAYNVGLFWRHCLSCLDLHTGTVHMICNSCHLMRTPQGKGRDGVACLAPTGEDNFETASTEVQYVQVSCSCCVQHVPQVLGQWEEWKTSYWSMSSAVCLQPFLRNKSPATSCQLYSKF